MKILKLFWGLVSFFPLLCFFLLQGLIVVTVINRDASLIKNFMSFHWVLILVAILLIVGSLYHLYKVSKVPYGKRQIWALSLIIFNVFSLPILHVWREPKAVMTENK